LSAHLFSWRPINCRRVCWRQYHVTPCLSCAMLEVYVEAVLCVPFNPLGAVVHGTDCSPLSKPFDPTVNLTEAPLPKRLTSSPPSPAGSKGGGNGAAHEEPSSCGDVDNAARCMVAPTSQTRRCPHPHRRNNSHHEGLFFSDGRQEELSAKCCRA